MHYPCLLTPPSNRRGPDFQQTGSLLHRISLQGQAQPYPQVRQGKPPPQCPPKCPPECPEVVSPEVRRPPLSRLKTGQTRTALRHFVSLPSRKCQLRGSLCILARIKGQNPQTSYGHRASASSRRPDPLPVCPAHPKEGVLRLAGLDHLTATQTCASFPCTLRSQICQPLEAGGRQ